MTAPIVPISAQAVASGASAQNAPEKARLHKAAQEFESLLVKQLLQASKLGGDKSSGYADMAIDAMATGVEKAGGLGLARRIEDTVAHSLRHGAQGTPEAPGTGAGPGSKVGPRAVPPIGSGAVGPARAAGGSRVAPAPASEVGVGVAVGVGAGSAVGAGSIGKVNVTNVQGRH
jgi:hypothetical protein